MVTIIGGGWAVPCDCVQQNVLDAKIYDFVLHFINIDKFTKKASFQCLVRFLVSHEKSATGEEIP